MWGVARYANRRFQFQKRSQLFIGMHNETLSRRRDVRQQPILFAPRESLLRHSSQLQPDLLRLSAMVSQYFGTSFCHFRITK
jgi:hypothetical protein